MPCKYTISVNRPFSGVPPFSTALGRTLVRMQQIEYILSACLGCTTARRVSTCATRSSRSTVLNAKYTTESAVYLGAGKKYSVRAWRWVHVLRWPQYTQCATIYCCWQYTVAYCVWRRACNNAAISTIPTVFVYDQGNGTQRWKLRWAYGVGTLLHNAACNNRSNVYQGESQLSCHSAL